MGWDTAKSNLRELFGTRSNCSQPSADKPGFAGGRPGVEGYVVSVALAAFVVMYGLF